MAIFRANYSIGLNFIVLKDKDFIPDAKRFLQDAGAWMQDLICWDPASCIQHHKSGWLIN
jgi:hypothetical protein